MGIKLYKPTTAGRRISSVQTFHDVTKQTPEKSLIRILKKNAGRNHAGKITVRHHGGGSKQFYRVVDFRRDRYDMPAKVIAIEYDPNRNTRIALVEYTDGVKSYIIASVGMKVGMTLVSSRSKVPVEEGNRMPLEFIPVGLTIYGVELEPGKGAKIARGAGTLVQLMAIEGKYAQLRLPSSEIRLVPKECLATIGQASNPDYQHIRWGKAGRSRHRGIRPTVRGKVMNPVDHPHGGGEGRNSIGLKHPKTPWGKPALGVKTRKHNKRSEMLIISRRKTRTTDR